METPNETRGDHYNCPCPHCGKSNNYIADGFVPPFREVRTFKKPCHYCGQEVFYQASWEITIKASTSNPLDP